MQYAVRHVTQFHYSAPVRESVMEVRMCPRTDDRQQCYSFELRLTPPAQTFAYRDHLDNVVHHFDLPGLHDALTLESQALVEVRPLDAVPEALPASAWDDLDRLVEAGRHWEMLVPSRYARPTDALLALAHELGLERRDDPLRLLRTLNAALYETFAYEQQLTHANSPIDVALHNRAGVCQDFAHIFIALVRRLGIPCRYVSGYLFHRTENHDRSAPDGSHAWAEALLPGLGWVGFDPTNDLVAGQRHIRVALGRDYADVPPTRGVFKGHAKSALRVGVQVLPARHPVKDEAGLALLPVTQNPQPRVPAAPPPSQQQ